MLTPNPTDRLHNQHPRRPLRIKSGQPIRSGFRGSILDADPPAQGVKFARRNTTRTGALLACVPSEAAVGPTSLGRFDNYAGLHRPAFFCGASEPSALAT